MRSRRYAFDIVRSTPAQDAALRERLREAVATHAGGSADKFGRMLGYANGGYIREILRDEKPKDVREALIDRVNQHPALRGLFDDILTPISAADVAAHSAGPVAWPFETFPRDEWDRLTERERGAIERAALQELDAIRARRRSPGEFGSLPASRAPKSAAV